MFPPCLEGWLGKEDGEEAVIFDHRMISIINYL